MLFRHASGVALGVLVSQSARLFGPDKKITTTIRWIAMTFCTNINVGQRMNPNAVGDPDFSSSATNRSVSSLS